MQTGFRFNLSPVKEPLGFVKILEWLAAVVAFSTCGGFSGHNVVSIGCDGSSNETLDVHYSYPFRLNVELLVRSNTSLCNRTAAETHLMGDASSSVQFFMVVGTLTFIYVMAALLVYTGYMHLYRDSDFGPMLDFVVTAALAFLWLVCSSAWARGLQTVKDATGTSGVRASLSLCQDRDVTCEVTQVTSTRSLDVSVVFGFVNLVIWAGNAWFAYKETRWHSQKVNAQQAAGRAPAPTHTSI